MIENSTYDWVVIGGGSAGYAAARTGVLHGLRTVVIEGGESIGGLCILRGCMPSKALLESANRYWSMRRAKEFGLEAEAIGTNPRVIQERKRRLIAEFANYRREQLESGKFDFIRGKARFLDANTLVVHQEKGEVQISGRAFLIATGSVISMPDVDGLTTCHGITSDEFLELETLPKSAVVLGGGAVALESAYYWNALGVEVTLLQRSEHLLTGMDPEAADTLAHALRKQGMQVICGTKLQRIICENGLKRVFYTKEGAEHSYAGEQLLIALGRKPATGELNLEQAGVQLAQRGRIIVNPAQQSSAPHIFAAGDVCSPVEVVHIAIQQGEIAAKNAVRLLSKNNELFEETEYRLKLFGVFTSPQLAACGATEKELSDAGRKFRTASYPFNDHGKSLVMGEEEGFVKLIVDGETNEILGATVIGPEAVELIHEIVVAMRFHATAKDLATTPHYHPTLSEIWTYPAEELCDDPPGIAPITIFTKHAD